MHRFNSMSLTQGFLLYFHKGFKIKAFFNDNIVSFGFSNVVFSVIVKFSYFRHINAGRYISSY